MPNFLVSKDSKWWSSYILFYRPKRLFPLEEYLTFTLKLEFV
ncbi:hypothetical protein LEP1GSC096_2107 [Leptospira interrogans serovar Hebdomadis str. R499]|nr:hypothetical protein LEP1GSC096_2107 [Leptospira interrogans serovar Hebdomadis str. R499]